MIPNISQASPSFYSPDISRIPSMNPTAITPEGKKDETNPVQKAECQTCERRKYMDVSNEGNVSFQAPSHVSPEQSGSKVMAHEQQHVRNALAEGRKENKKLVSVSVSLKMGVCSECGRSYVAGGTTRTRMLTYRDNPYDKARKTIEGSVLAGMNVNKKI